MREIIFFETFNDLSNIAWLKKPSEKELNKKFFKKISEDKVLEITRISHDDYEKKRYNKNDPRIIKAHKDSLILGRAIYDFDYIETKNEYFYEKKEEDYYLIESK